MLARLVLVPLDLRMAADSIERIAARAEARHLALGTGRDAPGPPRGPASRRLPTTTVDRLAGRPDDDVPGRTGRPRSPPWPRPAKDDLFELVFTSGTTGNPKGVMLSHANVLATISAIYKVIPPLEHRIVSLLPLSHLLEQIVGLYYAMDVLRTSGTSGAAIRESSSRPSATTTRPR